jgi:hypothetical protein
MRRALAHPRALAAAVAAVLAASVAVIAVAASGESPAAFDRPATAGDRLPPAAAAFLHPGASRRVATFTTAGGAGHTVFVDRSADGSQVCVWDADDATGAQSGGCNPAAGFFGGHALTVSLAYDGGPEPETVREARIVGLVTDAVASIEVVYADGSVRRAPITPDRAYAHTVPQGLLRRGAVPVAVVARDATGAVLERQATGIG